MYLQEYVHAIQESQNMPGTDLYDRISDEVTDGGAVAVTMVIDVLRFYRNELPKNMKEERRTVTHCIKLAKAVRENIYHGEISKNDG